MLKGFKFFLMQCCDCMPWINVCWNQLLLSHYFNNKLQWNVLDYFQKIICQDFNEKKTFAMTLTRI